MGNMLVIWPSSHLQCLRERSGERERIRQGQIKCSTGCNARIRVALGSLRLPLLENACRGCRGMECR
ncbi:hypothetical protein SCLCIDRAFT_1211225 [Scleroderma citrinum Foug A]|uniref:Uncharacterized protein n=1 Tax=Scleroderma citrinum Foug A TaxID=1036808 RepID=A0A0C3ANC4_9AGAM|nr:hypothetical protein SCLCIDRAFT_1211225 [Scleroderma citrinum Foug A]